jgi:Na+/citrate or Na+/malate symporter
LLSFVYALAMAHLLSTTALIIRESGHVRFSGLHAFWMLNALAVIMANWIGFWDMRGLPTWSIASIFFTFVTGFTNYLGAALVCPEVRAGEPLDLVDFAARQRTRYVGAALASVIVAAVGNAVYGAMFGNPILDVENLAVLPMLAAVVAALIWPQRQVQWAAAGVLTVTWIVYFTSLQPALK